MRSIPGPRLAALGLALGVAACDHLGLAGAVPPDRKLNVELRCVAVVQPAQMSCTSPRETLGASTDLTYGGQGLYVQLASANAAYNAGTQTFTVDVTVQNLFNEAIGTPDGVTLDADGVRVFFHSGPNVTDGTGEITVAGDGTGDFTGTNQPYFRYDEILDKDEVSAAKTWTFGIPTSVNSFSFTVLINAELQPLLVINEVFANPENAIADASGEWFEVYNAGTMPVQLQGMLIADSAASGRRPYHLIASSVVVPSGGYVVLGNTTNTTSNGGVTVDYAYGSALALANSLDAIKIARVYGTDSLTIDRTQYSNAAVSAVNGVSRELKNPALDNSNMDGSNWDLALVTAVYGAGGRGTPKAQNSTFTP